MFILKQCMSGYVLHNSLLHLLLKHCEFLNIDISQGSVATSLGCVGVFTNNFVTNFLQKSNDENWSTFGEVTDRSIVSCFLTHIVEIGIKRFNITSYYWFLLYFAIYS